MKAISGGKRAGPLSSQRVRHSRSGSPKRLRLRKILVATDFSRQSMKALRYASSLAAKFGATVHLLYVLDPVQKPPRAIIQLPMVTEPETIGRVAQRLLKNWAIKLEIPLLANTCQVRRGKASRIIVQTASQDKADLIVLGTHGYAGLKRMIKGSTTEHVLHHSRCPVLIVRMRERDFVQQNGGGERRNQRDSIKTILVPIDFSRNSIVAVKYAARVASAFGATLRLFHAINPYPETIGGERIPGETRSLLDAARKVARQQMDRLIRLTILRDVSWKTEVHVGSPIDQLCAISGSGDVDLIALSKHGGSGLNLGLGRVVKGLVRGARCPLIVVPGDLRT